ncbi:hypothetical protein D3C73_1157140 [compost metagenome]
MGVGGEEADGEGCQPHEDERCHEDGFAAELVAEVATDDATQWTGSEADAEGREGGQGASHRVSTREERCTEVQSGGGAETDEVVGFNDCANAGTDGDALCFLGSMNRTTHGQSFIAHSVFPFQKCGASSATPLSTVNIIRQL